MSYLFFPGCSLEGTARDFGVSTRAVFDALDIPLPDIPDWICCGSTPGHQSNPLLALALPARSLAAAAGKTVAVACAACTSRLKSANHQIAGNERLRQEVARVSGVPYDGSTPVLHILEILAQRVGAREIGARVRRPLAGLKVACYYGCLLVRPPEVMRFDDPEDPGSMDEVIEAIGADPIDWPHKTECCGGSYSITDPDIVKRLSREILSLAKLAGAECIATACPLCQMNLDLRQTDIEREFGEPYGLPVFQFTQLMGLAFGLDRSALGLRALVVDPTELLAQRGLIGQGARARRPKSKATP